MSSGRRPKDSGPHSFKREWQMLRTTPSLIVDVFENSLSTLYATTLARLPDGRIATSKKQLITPGYYTIYIYHSIYCAMKFGRGSLKFK